MNIQEAIKTVTEGGDLQRPQMETVMRTIMTGEATPAQIGGFLIGLRMKGETIDEITAAAGVMRSLATRVELEVPNLVDTCGTGGDGKGIFNVSTASAFVAAAAGAHVAKHGNRSVSSSSGSADLLEAAGVNIDLEPDQVARCVRELGVGFMFAPRHHAAMKHAIGPRREMGVRTIFNLLGPLSNPAMTPNQVVGVFSAEWLEPLAGALRELGSDHVLVVHAEDGLDELSIAAPTRIAELKGGRISTTRVTAAELGVSPGPLDELVVVDAEQSLALIRRALADEPGPARDMIVLNAGAAIYAAGVADSLQDGVAGARRAIADGAAQHKLEQLAAYSRQL